MDKSGLSGKKQSRYARFITIAALHVLLWASVFVATSTAYMFERRAVDVSLLIPEMLSIVTVSRLACLSSLLTSLTD